MTLNTFSQSFTNHRLEVVKESSEAPSHNCKDPSYKVECENRIGSFKCNCPIGLIWQNKRCVDKDECSYQNTCPGKWTKITRPSNLILFHLEGFAVCENSHGSFACNCKTGYKKHGTSCIDIDECFTGQNNCHNKARCENAQGSFRCICDYGYTGDGSTCKKPL